MASVAHLDFLSLIWKVLAIASGSIFLWAALFLKTDEEGNIQRTLEIWRDRLALWPSTTQARRSAALNFSAAAAISILNCIFGLRLFSVRAMVVSAALSIGSFLTVAGFDSSDRPMSAAGIILCIVAFAPSFRSGLLWVPIATTITLFVTWSVMYLDKHENLLLLAFVAITATVGIGSDFGFIALSRRILTWAATKATFGAATVVLIANLVLAVSLLAVPYELVVGIGRATHTSEFDDLSEKLYRAIAIYFAASNVFTALAAALVFMIGFLLVLDAVFWFFAERPVYAAARHNIIQKKKTLFVVGAGLIGSVFPKVGEIGLSLFERFVK